MQKRLACPKLNIRRVGDTTSVGGIAAPYLTPITYAGRREQIARGAFEKTLANKSNVRVYSDHSYTVASMIGSTDTGSVTLTDTPDGLEFSVELPNTCLLYTSPSPRD